MIPVDTSLKLNRYALFAQDEWRMTPNLTLSYGLRWDYQPPFREANDRISTFLPDIANPGAAGRPGALAFASTDVDRYGHSFQENWYNGYGPRLGIGYMVTPKTNLRASYGLYYNGTGNQNSVTPVGYQSSPSFQSPNNFTPVFNWNDQTFPQTFNRPRRARAVVRQRPVRHLHDAGRGAPPARAELHGGRGARADPRPHGRSRATSAAARSTSRCRPTTRS